MKQALEIIIKKIDQKLPIIIAGDFNSCYQTGINYGYKQSALDPLFENNFINIPLKTN